MDGWMNSYPLYAKSLLFINFRVCRETLSLGSLEKNPVVYKKIFFFFHTIGGAY